MHPEIQPELIRDLHKNESFLFDCHPGVGCFNECCRMLELALTPYDVLRLKNNLAIPGAAFLEQYAVIEQESPSRLPTIFLGMVDDGRGSCPFVSKEGCTVYENRPGACRTYPLGRGAYLSETGSVEELFVLLTEPHCFGCNENKQQSVDEWTTSQGLEDYNRYNDLMMSILHHEKTRNSCGFSSKQITAYLLGLYKLEEFRAALAQKTITLPTTLTIKDADNLADIELLDLGLQWVYHELFGE